MESLGIAYQDALKEITSHCNSRSISSFTPSDFPLADVSQEKIDQLQKKYNNLTDIYPTTGMQTGLLFHNFLNGKSAYVTQIEFLVSGEIDIDILKKAWISLIDRYAIFRTAFIDLDLEKPLQVVMKRVRFTLEFG